MSRSTSNSNEHLPPWLRDVPLPPRPAGVGDPAAHDQPTAMPGWLGAQSTQAPGSQAGAQAESSELPDWLRDLSADQAAAPAAPQSDLPDWLRSSPASGPGADTAETLPGWLSSNEPPPSAAPSPDADLPDWLRPAAATPGPAEQGTPAPLRDQSAPSSPATPVGHERPAGPPGRDETTSPTPSALSEDEDLDGVPSWLRDISLDEVRQVMSSDDETDIHVSPFTFEGATGPTSAEPVSDVPAWLSNASGESDTDSSSSWLDDIVTPTPPLAQNQGPALGVPDWLRAPDSAEQAAPSTTPANAPEPHEAVPDWLREIEQSTPPAPIADVPARLETPEEELAQPGSAVPDWLQASPGTAPSAPGDDLPDWLRHDMVPASPNAPTEELPPWMQVAPPSASTGEPAMEDVPDWLKAASPAAPASDDLPGWLKAEPATSASSAPPVDTTPTWMPTSTPVGGPGEVADDVPDWLKSAAAQPSDTPSSAQVADDVPDWLKGAATVQPSDAPSVSEDLPDWLKTGDTGVAPSQSGLADLPPGPDLPPWLRDDAGRPLTTSGAGGDAGLPAWLLGATTDQPLRDVPIGNEPVAEPTLQQADLTDVPPPPAGPPEEEQTRGRRGRSAPSGDENEFLVGTDLPAWLRTPEAEQPAETASSEARALDWLNRLGGVEEEPAVVPVASGPKLALPSAPTRTAAHVEAVRLLEQLAAEPFPESQPIPVATSERPWRRLGVENLLYLLMLIVLVAALMVPSLAASLQAPPIVPSAAPLFTQLDRLTENDVVLVGYEWDARRVSELRPLEQAVLGHLISKRVKLVLVSTDPQGTLLAYNLREVLQQAGYQPRGLDYIWLGYKPGGEMALRLMARNFRGALASDFYGDDANISALAEGAQTGKPLSSLGAFSAVLVLADDSTDVQGWMEQIHSSALSVPLAFLLPAEAAPIIQPYIRQSGVYYLAGKSGALAYESQRSGMTSQLAQEAGQQRLGLLVFAALFVIGALLVGVMGLAGRRRKTP